MYRFVRLTANVWLYCSLVYIQIIILFENQLAQMNPQNTKITLFSWLFIDELCRQDLSSCNEILKLIYGKDFVFIVRFTNFE